MLNLQQSSTKQTIDNGIGTCVIVRIRWKSFVREVFHSSNSIDKNFFIMNSYTHTYTYGKMSSQKKEKFFQYVCDDNV